VTLDLAAALSLLTDLPRLGLTERMRANDPELQDLAERMRIAAQQTLAGAATQGIRFVPWNSADFPPQLLELPDTPPGLWYRGSLSPLRAPYVVAVVGSRSGSTVALEAASQLSRGLAARGVVVVSGLARGVDSAAHRGALKAGGLTVAVLGSGLARVYPPEHRSLADEIAGTGVVVSELPPDAPPLPFHFPLRNRIISGLSRAVVVIEASEKSGSLITASCALEQGREVMAVPGSVLSGRNKGGHALLRDGAALVETAEDVLAALGWDTRHEDASCLSSNCSGDGSGSYLLARMRPGHPYDLDEIARETGLAAPALLGQLTALELAGCLRRVDGGRFVRAS